MTIQAGGADTALRLVIGPDSGFVVLENDCIRLCWVRHHYQEGYDETVLREFVDKATGDNQAGCDGLDMSWYGAAEGRGLLTKAQLIHRSLNRISVRLEWSHGKGVQEVSIWASRPYVRLDYIEYGVNIVDIGCPGYARNYAIYGAGDWVRGCVDYPESYYNRFAGDGVYDQSDAGSLNYDGWFIVGLCNQQNGRGYGRVMPVSAIPIIKLLPWHGRGFEMFPHYQDHPNTFTGYLFAVKGGEAGLLSLGCRLADGAQACMNQPTGG